MKQALALLGLLLAASIAQANGIIFAPGGRTYLRFDSPNGDSSLTFGPRGQTWQTFRDPNGDSITFGPRGRVFQEFNDPPSGRWGGDNDGDDE